MIAVISGILSILLAKDDDLINNHSHYSLMELEKDVVATNVCTMYVCS
jgi:hypothetical protein